MPLNNQVICFYFYFQVLGIKLRASHVLGLPVNYISITKNCVNLKANIYRVSLVVAPEVRTWEEIHWSFKVLSFHR